MVSKENSEDKKFTFTKDLFKKGQSSYIPMGQYVPINRVSDKLSAEELEKIDAKEFLKKNMHSNPFQNKPLQEHKICFFDGDYLQPQSLEKNDLYSFSGNIIMRFFKLIFFSLPIINFLYLKFKESKIKESILKLNSLNGNVDKFSKHFEGKSIINEQKYREIYAELIKANSTKI